MKCPCKECLLIPVCRHKHYSKLLNDCYIIRNSLYIKANPTFNNRKSSYVNYVESVETCIKPKRWYLQIDNNGFGYIMTKDNLRPISVIEGAY